MRSPRCCFGCGCGDADDADADACVSQNCCGSPLRHLPVQAAKPKTSWTGAFSHLLWVLAVSNLLDVSLGPGHETAVREP
jgi:hypothetical protein